MSSRCRNEQDLIPSEEYDAEDSSEAIGFAEAIITWVEAGLGEVEAPS